METARIIEIFPSIQGEGPYVGAAHLFVRFWNCNMACHYCDTNYDGPYTEVDQAQLLDQVKNLTEHKGPFKALSLTGGEPLLWSKFLVQWLPQVKEQLGLPIYLETNATLPDALGTLLPWLDTVAVDIKPPSATNDKAFWQAHQKFLEILKTAGKEVLVKLVVTADTTDEEIRMAADLVQQIQPSWPVILQPVTPDRDVDETVPLNQLMAWNRQLMNQLPEVRVIPQVHRMLGVQ